MRTKFSFLILSPFSPLRLPRKVRHIFFIGLFGVRQPNHICGATKMKFPLHRFNSLPKPQKTAKHEPFQELTTTNIYLRNWNPTSSQFPNENLTHEKKLSPEFSSWWHGLTKRTPTKKLSPELSFKTLCIKNHGPHSRAHRPVRQSWRGATGEGGSFRDAKR